LITRRFILGGLLAGVAAPALAEVMATSPRPMPRGGRSAGAPAVADAAALVAAAKLTGTVAYVVADAATGSALEARDALTPMPPASVAKSLTTLYALEKLGAGRRFLTRVLATGPLQDGIVQGDLVLAGGGDPTLQTDQLGDLVQRLRQRGLQGATGRFLFWEGALPQLARVSEEQPDHVGYNPAISGLNLNFNRVHFEWRKAGSDWKLAMDARGERFVPAVDMVRMRVARREAPLFTHEVGAGEEDWTVASAALGKGGSRWLPVRRPGLYLAEVFGTLAAAQGIRLPAAEPVATLPPGAEIGRVESDPLPEVLRAMLKYSTNLTAECIGLAASGRGDLAASAGAMSDWLDAAFGVTARFADHSGLGGGSRISAADMVAVLAGAGRAGAGPGLKPLLREVGMRDEAGKVIEGHPVKVVAKTGTLNFVSGLAGHIDPPGGRAMVFAIFTGDPARRDAVPLADRENPPGAAAWVKRSRRLQGQLIARWAGLYA
jgi:D-alanyl-D-alanine carboxypeptidase/D-alanyl-D-alanine-endopeptidase (penicillin-binding protein 4)